MVATSMKVYFARTEHYSAKEFNLVFRMLKTLSGPLHFSKVGRKNSESVWDFIGTLRKNKGVSDLDGMGFFDEPESSLMTLIPQDENRASLNIDPDSFVVILNDQYLDENCFCKYDLNRNIQVSVSDWGKYTDVNPALIIALVILEIIEKILLRIDYNSALYSYELLPKIANIRKDNSSELHLVKPISPTDYFEKIKKDQISIVAQLLGIDFTLRNYYSQSKAASESKLSVEAGGIKEKYLEYLKVEFGFENSDGTSSAIKIDCDNITRNHAKIVLEQIGILVQMIGNEELQLNKNDASIPKKNKTQIKKEWFLSDIFFDTKKNKYEKIIGELKKVAIEGNKIVEVKQNKIYWGPVPNANFWQMYLAGFLYELVEHDIVDKNKFSDSIPVVMEILKRTFNTGELNRSAFDTIKNDSNNRYSKYRKPFSEIIKV